MHFGYSRRGIPLYTVHTVQKKSLLERKNSRFSVLKEYRVSPSIFRPLDMAAGFRLALKNISDRFSSQDLVELKYLCEDVIPAGELEKLNSGTQLFSALQRRNKISEGDLAFLDFLLEAIGKKHLLKYCTDAGYGQAQLPGSRSISGNEVGVSSSGVVNTSSNLDLEYRKTLAIIAAGLTPHNFTEMLYLSADHFNGVQPKAKKPLEFFTFMEQHRLLMPGNLSTLHSLLASVGRQDLADKLVPIADLAKFSGPQPHRYDSTPSAPTPHQYPSSPLSSGQIASNVGLFNLQKNPGTTGTWSGVQDRADTREDLPTSSKSTGSSMNDIPMGEPVQTSQNVGTVQTAPPTGSVMEPQSVVDRTQGEMVIGGRIPMLSTGNIPSINEVVLSVERSAVHEANLEATPLLKEYHRKEIQEEMMREEQASLRLLEKNREHEQREKQLRSEIQQLEKQREMLAHQLQQAAATSHRMPKQQRKDLCYPMKSEPHGLCLIINNYKFYSTTAEGPLPDRRGSSVDEHNLNIIFTRLNYKIEVIHNATGASIMQKLKDVSSMDHSRYDSFVCCLLTHGKMNGIYGADGNLVSVADLANFLKGVSCPSLNGKPKMFFVQACRGDDEDKGATLESDDGPDSNHLGRSLPNAADFLFAYSTAPGTVSWRSIQYGSWYISKLCEVLDQHAKEGMDLLSMLTIVNDKVSQAYTKQGFKQCPAPVNMLRKQVIFV